MSEVKKLYISTRCMVTAFDADDKPIEEYTGTLADIGPKLVSELGIAYENIQTGDLTPYLKQSEQ